MGPVSLFPRGNFEVLISSTPDFATYTTLIPLHDFTNSSFVEDSALFTGTGITYIAFRLPPNMPNPTQTGLVTIDDFVIEDAPACPNPNLASLTATNITQTAATLAWTPGFAETQWQVVVQAPMSGIPTGSGTTVNTTPSYNATNLTLDTAYEFYVRAICGADNSDWIGPFNFRTICNPLPTPFLETFDTTSQTETCWTIYNNNADANQWNLNQTVQPMFGNQMAALFTGMNGANNDWLITPTLTAHAGQRLRFHYKTYSSDFEEDLKVMLSINGVATNQFSTILYENNFTTTIDAAGTTEGFNTITVANGSGVRVGDTFYIPGFPIPFATTVTNVTGNTITVSAAATLTMAGPLHIVFTHETINNEDPREMVINLTDITTPTNINIAFHTPFFPPNPWNYRGQYTFIDNVIVEDIPACPEVINVTTNNIIDTSAQVNWTPTGSETSWQISVQPYGTPAPVGDTLPAYLYTANAHPFTVTGLTPSTLYQYYVRAVCSGSSQSEWVGPFEILTKCDYTNVCQYTMSVTNGNTGTVTDNVTVMQNGTVVQALEFPGFGQPAILDYQVFLCSGVEFSLYWNGFGSGVQYAEAQIVIRDEANNIVWTSPLGLGSVNTTLFTSVATCGVVTCPQPTNLTVSNQGVFSWTPGGSETQWEVFVQPYQNGTIPQSGIIVNTPSYTPAAGDFANATNGTYEYLVRAVCGASDTSYWSGPKVFIRNDEPVNAVRLQINTGSACELSGQDASFISATASTVPTSCIGPNGGDIWYDFVATSKVHTIELSDFAPGTYYDGGFVGMWPQITMSLYEVQGNGSLVEKGCSNNNSFVAKYASELVVGNTYKIRLTLNDPLTSDKTFHICVTTPEDLCDMDAFNYSFEKLPMQSVSGVLTIINSRVTPGWRTNTDWGTMFFLEGNNIGVTPYEGGQCIQLTQDGQETWDPSDPNIKGLYKDFDTSEITKMDYSFASATRQISGTGTTVELFAGPPTGPFTVIAQDNAISSNWDLIQGTYDIPTGQTTTRFIFRTVGNDIGHLLDAANFKANVEINIATANTTLDCTTTSMAFDAYGVGTWEADANNPATTIIATPNNGSTTVSGFTVSGTYTFYWNTRYCQKSIVITKIGTTDVPVVLTPVNYCQGATATPLAATAPNSGDSLLWYTQAIGGNGTTTAPTPQTATTGTTSYYVTVVGSGGCEGPRTEIVVEVNAIPTAAISGTTTICQGSTATITFTGSPNATVTFTANSGTPQTITLDASGLAVLTTPILTNTTTYDLVSVTSTGTTPCSQSLTGSVLITVEALPTATISGTTSVCINAPCTNITFTGANGVAPYTFSYTINNGPVQTITSVAGDIATICVPTSTAGIFIYDLVSVSGSGAASCSQAVTGSATITVNPLTTPNLTFSYAQACTNAGANPLPILPVNFTSGGVYSSSTVTVDPTTGAVNLATASVGSHQIIYTLTANPSACVDGGTFTATIAIVSSVTPVTGFSYDLIYCANAANDLPTTLTGFTTGGVFSATGGLIINPATGEINIAQSNPGNYTITYTVAQDVATCNAGGSNAFNIEIVADLSFIIDSFCQDSSLMLQVTNANFDTVNATYTWTQGTTTIGTNVTLNVDEYLAQNPSLNLPLLFSVSVVSNGCTKGQSFTVENNPCKTIPRGISPNNDELNDTFDLTGYGVKDILIFNRYGTKVYSFSGNYTNQWKGQSDGGQELPDGTYFYSIHTTAEATKTGWVYINREY
ncbi:MAG: gliding motility-associated C-terminal domain-containing protein [Flavobacterium sp. JAD_PAG50586_2]|nr:MAG: gliding motility-associated C-terminal domain-containing protein [Flavobacterium sp. JAD_PAG50586_2]